jgi:hypothetical protein
MAPRGAVCAWRVSSIAESLRGFDTNELTLFKAWPAGKIVSVLRAHALATKTMFWAVARAGLVLELPKSLAVTIKKFHGLRSKLLQLFYFSTAPS